MVADGWFSTPFAGGERWSGVADAFLVVDEVCKASAEKGVLEFGLLRHGVACQGLAFGAAITLPPVRDERAVTAVDAAFRFHGASFSQAD